ncbi:hypothetical protein MnTg03_00334 [bacterium MnTg03]|nr:hypothetical protein MnTg03_00334 [bacterium MnTg03]
MVIDKYSFYRGVEMFIEQVASNVDNIQCTGSRWYQVGSLELLRSQREGQPGLGKYTSANPAELAG